MIRVLIVDDSAVARQLLAHLLTADPQIQVAGVAANGAEALRFIEHDKPDVVTMDINMPVMDGFEATRRIMESRPVPIVVVSSAYDPKEAYTSFRALEAGALAVMARPPGPASPKAEEAARLLLQTVKTIAGVSVIRRWRAQPAAPPKLPPLHGAAPFEVVVIGTSTGGPIALNELLKSLPREFPVPIAVVQHITPGFCQTFVEWLAQSTGYPVALARHRQVLAPGHCYVAPDGAHLELAAGLTACLTSAPPDAGLRPSVKRLFHSAAAVYRHRVAAVLLTGMGRDGAEELRALRDLGALTFAQDQDSSVIHGMPGEAIRLGAAVHVLPPALIAAQLTQAIQSPTAPPL